jgi:addiction module HigA family antidote
MRRSDHPGIYLAAELEAREISTRELGRLMHRPAWVFNQIISGKRGFTVEVALQLERVLGIPAHEWVDRQARYDLAMARQRETEGRAAGLGRR